MTSSLKRTYDSDPTPAMVSPILTTAKSEPVVPPVVGVAWIWSGPESAKVGQSHLESAGVVRSRLESEHESSPADLRQLRPISDYSG